VKAFRAHCAVIAATVTGTLFAMTLAGCSRGPAENSHTGPIVHRDASALFVGYANQSNHSPLLTIWATVTCQKIVEAGGKCVQTDAQLDITKQIADVEDLIAQGVNVLVINPADAEGIVPAIRDANRQGIPVFTIDSTTKGAEIVTAVHVDNAAAGYGAAKYCAEMHRGEKNIEVAELEGQAGHGNTINRHAGWEQGLRDFAQLKNVFDQYTEWAADRAQAATQDLLSAHPSVKCIWAHTDVIILGAVHALKGAGRTDVITVGMGMYGGGPEAIQAGDLTASWYMEPVKTAEVTATAVIEYWTKGTSVKDITIPMTFVTKDNVAKYLQPTQLASRPLE
jgi:ribose transport system substrate-binding protein